MVCCVMLIKLMTMTAMIDAGGGDDDGKHVFKVFGRVKIYRGGARNNRPLLLIMTRTTIMMIIFLGKIFRLFIPKTRAFNERIKKSSFILRIWLTLTKHVY